MWGALRSRSQCQVVALVALLAAVVGAPREAAAQSCTELGAKEIHDRVDDIYRGTSSFRKATMKVVTAHWTRTLKLEAWSKGTKRSLVRIVAPAKEKGTATLMVDKNVWNYLPKVRKTIKIPSSMMTSSWMGSHVTNDDLVKESRMSEDYTFQKSFTGPRGGRKIIEITCIPKPKAAIVWGKVLVEVDAASCLPTRQLFYGENAKLARTMLFEEPKTVGRRTVPVFMKVTVTDKPNEVTELRQDDLSFDIPLKDDFFSLHNLER